MKTAKFKYEGSPRDKRVEKVWGKVTLKDDGKVSISFPGIKDSRVSYAAKYAAQLLAKEIVKADFNHPAAYDVESSESSKGLKKQLLQLTTEFHDDYIMMVIESAGRIFKNAEKVTARTREEWFKVYGIEFKYVKYGNQDLRRL